jgi:hypothetical protein
MNLGSLEYLLVAPCIAIVYLNYAFFEPDKAHIQPWATEAHVFYVTVFYIQVSTLVIIIVFHLYSLINGIKHSTGDNLSNTNPLALILGQFLFQSPHPSYTSRLFQFVQGISAGTLISILLAYTIFAIVILPAHERGLVPLKEYRTDDLLTDNPSMESPVLTITAVSALSTLSVVHAYALEFNRSS